MLKVDIKKTFPDFNLQMKFSLPPGISALFGPSGAGKSLTLKYISGIQTPDEGEIILKDRILYHSTKKINLPPQKRNIGFLFQNYALFPHLSVADNIIYGIHHLPQSEKKEKLQALLKTMRLENLKHKKPGEISGGQQQRVALARTLATNPEMILLDEPFSALDSAVKSRLRSELLDILNHNQIPAILVTHDLNEAYSLSQHLTIIESGKILQSDDKNRVIHSPSCITVAKLIRTKNIFSGNIENVFPDKITVKTSLGFLYICIQALNTQAFNKLIPGENIDLFIRPHHIRIYKTRKTLLPTNNIFPCKIINIINHIDGHTIFLKKERGLPLRKENIYVKIDDASFQKLRPLLNETCLCYFPPEFIGLVQDQ